MGTRDLVVARALVSRVNYVIFTISRGTTRNKSNLHQ
jgi:hypothetical protein